MGVRKRRKKIKAYRIEGELNFTVGRLSLSLGKEKVNGNFFSCETGVGAGVFFSSFFSAVLGGGLLPIEKSLGMLGKGGVEEAVRG